MTQVTTTTPEPARQPLLILTRDEKLVLGVCVGSALVGYLFAFPALKYVLGALWGFVFLTIPFRHFYIGIALFAFFLPLQAFLTDDSLLFRGLNAETVVVAYFLLLSAFAKENQLVERSVDRPRNGARNVALVPLCALVVVVILSAIHASLMYQASLADLLSKVKNWFIYSIFVYLTFKHVRGEREKLFVLLFILLVIVLCAADSLAGVFAIQGLGLDLMRHRASSLITPQPNLYGGFLAMYLFFFIALLIHYPMSPRMRIIVGAATALGVVNLVYTFSRGAWLASALALLISGTKSKRLLVPLALIFVGVYFWVPEVAVERFQSGFEGEYDPALLTSEDTGPEEAASRIIQWRSFIPMLVQNPIFGVGLGRYGEVYMRGGYDIKPRSAHSSVIEIAIEEGLIGLILYGWLLWSIYRAGADVFRKTGKPVEKVLALGVMGATLCLFFLDLSGTRFRNGHVMAFYWILSGMTLNARPSAGAAVEESALDSNRTVLEN